MQQGFWVLMVLAFLVTVLIPLLSFELVALIDLMLFLGMGYYYWENEKEKEERLKRLEEKVKEKG
jgi:uncharacterized membrane protein